MTVPLLSFTPEAAKATFRKFRGCLALRLVEEYENGDVVDYKILPAYVSEIQDFDLRTTVRYNCRKVYFLVAYELMKKIEYSEVSYDENTKELVIKNLIEIRVPLN